MPEMEMNDETNSQAGPDITEDVDANEDVGSTDVLSTIEDVGAAEDEDATEGEGDTADEDATEDEGATEDMSTTEDFSTVEDLGSIEDVGTGEEVSITEDTGLTEDMGAFEDVSLTEDMGSTEDVSTEDVSDEGLSVTEGLSLTEDLSSPGDVGITEGVSTSPPDQAENEDPEEWDHQLLLQKFEELRAKYANAKRHYFERDAQVAELQKSLDAERHSVSDLSLGSAQLGFDEDGCWNGYDAGLVDDDIEFGQGEFPSYDIDDACTSPVRGLATEDDSMREYIDSQMTLRSSAEKQIAQLIEERADLQRQLAEKKLDDLRSEVQARKLMKENGRLRGELLEIKRKWVVE